MKLILEQITKSFGPKSVLKGAGYTFEQGRIYGYTETKRTWKYI